MRHEPLEIALSDRSHSRRSRRLNRRPAASLQSGEHSTLPQDAIDEAFADPQTAGETAAEGKQAILGELSAQVVAIDRQCQLLTRLIQSLEAETLSAR